MKKVFYSKFFFCFFLLAFDVISKLLALKYVPPLSAIAYPFGGIGIFALPGLTFSLNTVFNTGMAWGLFSGFTSLLLILRLCIIAGLLGFLFFRPAKAPFALWLIATGAFGNIIDMFCYGYVIDFLHLQILDWSFPIFNVADSLITIGAALLFLQPRRRTEFQQL